MDIAENIRTVKENIALAATRSGRSPDDILLVGASKMNDVDTVRAAIAAGLGICGENRVQEMLEKNALGAYDGAELHFIGHLQKNKVKNVVGLAKLIHSVDSEELMETISKTACRMGITQDVLIEINIARETAKSGFAPEKCAEAIEFASKMPGLRVRGLMCVPPICAFGEENRPYFTLMRKLFIDNSEKKYDNVDMDFMSMGMSGDYMTAIECGANMVRVGSAIFGPRNYLR